jgi:hypothetical protein
MAARQQADEYAVHDLVLSDDDLTDLLANTIHAGCS